MKLQFHPFLFQELISSSGKRFKISSLSTNQNKFARELVRKLYGEDFMKNRIFESGGSSDRIEVDADVVDTLKGKDHRIVKQTKYIMFIASLRHSNSTLWSIFGLASRT